MNSIGLINQIQYDNFTAKISDMLHGSFCVGRVTYPAAYNDPYAPIQTGNTFWWSIITFGVANRCVQIAVQTYRPSDMSNILFLRKQHDDDVSAWGTIM